MTLQCSNLIKRIRLLIQLTREMQAHLSKARAGKIIILRRVFTHLILSMTSVITIMWISAKCWWQEITIKLLQVKNSPHVSQGASSRVKCKLALRVLRVGSFCLALDTTLLNKESHPKALSTQNWTQRRSARTNKHKINSKSWEIPIYSAILTHQARQPQSITEEFHEAIPVESNLSLNRPSARHRLKHWWR